MKLQMEAAPVAVTNALGVDVGNVYRNQMGRLYLVVSKFEGKKLWHQDEVGPTKCIALCIERDGTIVNATQPLPESYFLKYPLVGKADLPAALNVEWFIP